MDFDIFSEKRFALNVKDPDWVQSVEVDMDHLQVLLFAGISPKSDKWQAPLLGQIRLSDMIFMIQEFNWSTLCSTCEFMFRFPLKDSFRTYENVTQLL